MRTSLTLDIRWNGHNLDMRSKSRIIVIRSNDRTLDMRSNDTGRKQADTLAGGFNTVGTIWRKRKLFFRVVMKSGYNILRQTLIEHTRSSKILYLPYQKQLFSRKMITSFFWDTRGVLFIDFWQNNRQSTLSTTSMYTKAKWKQLSEINLKTNILSISYQCSFTCLPIVQISHPLIWTCLNIWKSS